MVKTIRWNYSKCGQNFIFTIKRQLIFIIKIMVKIKFSWVIFYFHQYFKSPLYIQLHLCIGAQLAVCRTAVRHVMSGIPRAGGNIFFLKPFKLKAYSSYFTWLSFERCRKFFLLYLVILIIEYNKKIFSLQPKRKAILLIGVLLKKFTWIGKKVLAAAGFEPRSYPVPVHSSTNYTTEAGQVFVQKLAFINTIQNYGENKSFQRNILFSP